MAQSTINERLKILIDALGMSARAFSSAIGSGDTNTRNYLDRGSKPGADYLEKIVRRFETVNSVWLLTGEGELFLPNSEETSEPRATYQNNVSGIAQTGKNSKATQNNFNLDDCKKDLHAAQKEIALLTSQLADKERIIQLLEKSGGR